MKDSEQARDIEQRLAERGFDRRRFRVECHGGTVTVSCGKLRKQESVANMLVLVEDGFGWLKWAIAQKSRRPIEGDEISERLLKAMPAPEPRLFAALVYPRALVEGKLAALRDNGHAVFICGQWMRT